MPTQAPGQIHESPIDALLGRYAAGALDPALHALVAAHLEMKPDNRSFVQALEGLEADHLMAGPQTPLSGRDARLADIFADEAPVRAKPRNAHGSELPFAIRRFIGRDLNGVAWKSLLPGVRECKFGSTDGAEASLLWIGAGKAVPSHTHEGAETTLVLRGAFSDLHGHYGAGDIAFADSDVDHKPVVDKGGDCICFAVTEGHLHLTGPVGRIIDRFFGPR